MKSWTHPETETVYSYVGAVISMGIVLLTIQHWTFDVAAFPIFIVVHGLGRGRPGRLRAGPAPARRRARHQDAALAEPTSTA